MIKTSKLNFVEFQIGTHHTFTSYLDCKLIIKALYFRLYSFSIIEILFWMKFYNITPKSLSRNLNANSK